MAFSMGMSWSEGEEKMHNLLHLPPQDNPTSAMLTPQAAFMLQRAPLLAMGTLDTDMRPWTALWGGAPGFSEPIGGGFVGTRTLVDGKYDPVVQALVGSKEKGEMLQPTDGGKMLSGLAIDLVTRKRVKIAGKMVAGTLRDVDVEVEGDTTLPDGVPKTQSQIQLVTKIEQSLGNCPKYLNQYELKSALVTPEVLSEGPALSDEARALIDKADMFFLSTSTDSDMDTNHRGGPPGFVRTISPTCIIYPEYSGNRLYQSLGNLKLNPRIGITFPDYDTGSVLYTTGTAEILIGTAAAHLLPGTNLAVKISLTHTHYIRHGLPFRGTLQLNGYSPYNPHVRALASEGNRKALPASPTATQTARLVQKTLLTPDIARFTFAVRGGGSFIYKPAQWVALSFKQELDMGYSHMRNDDPRSLNDDFVRTFTISSTPPSHGANNEQPPHFDITIRRVGPATAFLFQQNDRAGLELPLLGIGGDFAIAQAPPHDDDGEGGGARDKDDVRALTPFIAAGVGITPLLSQLHTLDLSPRAFRLFWTVKGADLGLVQDTLARYPGLREPGVTSLFVTGGGDETAEGVQARIGSEGVLVYVRRMEKSDLESVGARKWYLCAGKPFRALVLRWLEGREVVFEDFDY